MAHPLDKPHLVKRTLDEAVFYPPHPPRTESKEYREMHHRLVVVEDHPCLVCGVRNSTLADPTHNRVGATAIETHHHLIEWSLAKAIDLAKFNNRIVIHMRRIKPDEPIYAADFTQQQMEDWIDHHPDNIWILCDVHHRGRLVGIHDVTGPVFGPQDLLLDEYQYTPAVTNVTINVAPGTGITVSTPEAQPRPFST